ncbi:MAG: hypothetical protein PHY34_00615 [Patescibacteria group bacterium]|nr:hypothetical protein [Patescibacteria group bacterium]MDD5715868.1 hypothetical protein [Patescibacteria group bacterium]
MNRQRIVRINAWDAELIISALRPIIFDCIRYATGRGAPVPTADSLAVFWKAIAHTCNMYYPESLEARRPRFAVEDVTVVFDNGIREQTDHDNYPTLYVEGRKLCEFEKFEASGVEVGLSREQVYIMFRGNEFRFGSGYATVDTAIPVRLTDELV